MHKLRLGYKANSPVLVTRTDLIHQQQQQQQLCSVSIDLVTKPSTWNLKSKQSFFCFFGSSQSMSRAKGSEGKDMGSGMAATTTFVRNEREAPGVIVKSNYENDVNYEK